MWSSNTFSSLALSLLCSTSLVSASLASLNDVPHSTSGAGSTIPNRYIVEFSSTSAYQSSGISQRDASPHEAVYRELQARKVKYTVNQQYQSDLFVGASISLSSDADLASLASTNGVINILPVHSLSLPADPVSASDLNWPNSASSASRKPKPSTTSSAVITTQTTCTGSGKKQKCTTQTVTSYPTSTAKVYPTTGYSILPQLQADRVQATGNKGKGIKIGIIDSGVDYTRTPLGGCFGPGCKIVGGYDFVGDNYNGSNAPVPDNDPFDNCYQHGTIVAGIIGANDNEYNVTGVAPEASLYQYRVFGCNGASSDDIVIEAMQRAYNDGVDIINLSLGDESAWTEGALSVVGARLVSKGVVVVASAGNRGQIGSFYPLSPASGVGVISAGSVDNANFPAQIATTNTGRAITYYNFLNPPPATLPIYVYASQDGCNPPDDTPDLSGYVVVVLRGACSISQKARAAYIAGSRYVLVVNYPNTAPQYSNFPLLNAFGFVSNDDGNYLISQNGTSTTLTFGFAPTVVPDTFTGNTTSYFSEIGPTNDLYLGTSILAPGNNIIGVVPTTYSNWSITDGTSWSSAFAAGAAALYLNAKGANNVCPDDVKGALEFSGKILPVSRSDSSLETVAAQGAGQLQIFDAINSATTISPTELLLNDTAYFASTQYITVTNNGNSRVSYKVSNLAAGTALSFTAGTNQSADQPVPQVANAASIRIFPSSFSLKNGDTQTVLLKFTAPTGLDPKQFPIYSGWVQVTGGSTPVQVPYLGVAAVMKNMPVLDPSTVAFGYNTPVIMAGDSTVQSGTRSYTFKDGDFPTAVYRLSGGTPLLLIDLVNANASLGFTPNYNTRRSATPEPDVVEVELMKRSLEVRRVQSNKAPSSQLQGLLYLWCQLTKGKGQGCCGSSGTGNTFAKVPILGNLYEADYIPRSTDNVDGAGNMYSTFALSTPTFTNGTTIPNGTYRFLLRTLHITGDMSKEADYEAWLSMPFVVAQ